MTHTHRPSLSVEIGSFLLGQASVWWGLVVALGYDLAFALILSHQGSPSGSSPSWSLYLPLEYPLIGLGLGGLGILIARLAGQRASGYCVAGLVLNGVALILALTLWLLAGIA